MPLIRLLNEILFAVDDHSFSFIYLDSCTYDIFICNLQETYTFYFCYTSTIGQWDLISNIFIMYGYMYECIYVMYSNTYIFSHLIRIQTFINNQIFEIWTIQKIFLLNQNWKTTYKLNKKRESARYSIVLVCHAIQYLERSFFYNGNEFKKDFLPFIKDFGIKPTPAAMRNIQVGSILEIVHQV